MAQAKNGDMVQVHYTGRLDDGRVFDSSQGSDPLEFTLGQGQVIPGFEDAVRGMESGETKTVTIPEADAYGPHRNELLLDVKREEFPDDMQPQVGMQLQLKQLNGESFQAMIVDVGDETVRLDANHPLAGQDLTFEINLVQIA
ncbi:MAG: peptidylprolyl isomerase [Chloroflexi bacterium]|nr:peptidylprolyl isomerase [Chloroflexota bacterium]